MDLIAYEDEYLRILEKLRKGEKISATEWGLIERYEEEIKYEEELKKKQNRRLKHTLKRPFKAR